jgi:hypothetical protein
VWSDEVILFDIDADFFEMCVLCNSLLPFMCSFAHAHLVIKFLVMVQFFLSVQKYKDVMRMVKFEGFIEATTY